MGAFVFKNMPISIGTCNVERFHHKFILKVIFCCCLVVRTAIGFAILAFVAIFSVLQYLSYLIVECMRLRDRTYLLQALKLH